MLSRGRGREDPVNAVIAGALTGGTLAARAGLKSIGKNALIGGALLAMIEGLGMAITHMTKPEAPQPIPVPAALREQTLSGGVGGIGGLSTTSGLSPIQRARVSSDIWKDSVNDNDKDFNFKETYEWEDD